MHKPHEPGNTESFEEARKRGYEAEELALVTLLKWGAGLAVFVGVSLLFALGIYFLFVSRPMTTEANIQFPMRTAQRLPPPNVPMLQAEPVTDIKNFRRIEAQKTDTYGYTKEGHIHVPVDRALEIIAHKGLPTVGQAMPRPANGPHPPTPPAMGATPQPTNPGVSYPPPSEGAGQIGGPNQPNPNAPPPAPGTQGPGTTDQNGGAGPSGR